MVYGDTGTIAIMNHVKSRMINFHEACECWNVKVVSNHVQIDEKEKGIR